MPSIIEGVGFVALEAAAYGAEIVLTNIGAPKEYYDGRAFLVSPYRVDEIGIAICEALEKGKAQPELQKYIIDNYSFKTLSKNYMIGWYIDCQFNYHWSFRYIL